MRCQTSMPGALSLLFSGASADASLRRLAQVGISIADINYLDYVWRIIIGFSAIPTFLTIYLRCESHCHPKFHSAFGIRYISNTSCLA